MRPDQLLLKISPDVWTKQLQEEFAAIAMEQYPLEACAFVIKNKLVPVQNVAKDPTNNFELSIEDSLLAIKAQAFVHSHPDGPIYPSASDMKSQRSANIPFGIVTCTPDSASNPIWLSDKNLDAQLEERPFIHGIFDCYSLIRAYFWQSKKIKLDDYARDYEWWVGEKDKPIQDLYMQNFAEWGFEPLKQGEEMQEGDIILMDIQTGVVSHAAIYLGNGLLLHHLRGKISKKDNAHSWKKFYHIVVRYNGNN